MKPFIMCNHIIRHRQSLYAQSVTIISCFILAFLLSVYPSAPVIAQFTEVPEGYSSHILWVRCHDTHDAHSVEDLIPAEYRNSIVGIRPLFSLPRETLIEMRMTGEQLSGKELPALYQWYEITLDQVTDIVSFTEVLMYEHAIAIAEPAPLPAPSPSHEPTPDFTDLQGYLNPATDGINAEYSWDFPGGNGNGVKIYDIEYSWNLTHEDLSKAHGIELIMEPGDVAIDPFDSDNHGTAVLGQLIADNDDKGVTGISWGADIGVAPQNTQDQGNNIANAIALSVADGQPGDVILLETQNPVCGLPAPCTGPGGNCGPSEWIDAVFDAVETATANGYIVVAAAGNGGVDLDQEGCEEKFDRNIRDSGAIIVGAGGSPDIFGNDRTRLDFSSYGSRVDLQGWGEMVMTTGYGTHHSQHDDPTDRNFWYRRDFNGTSSASPIVTGAAANLQGISKAVNGALLTSTQIRDILVSTGSPQLGNVSENIGPRPDLRFAIAQIINVPPVADAGPDQTLECESHDGSEVTLDGSGSFDDNGDALTYTWSIDDETIAGPTSDASVVVTLPLGVNVVTLEVSDNEFTDTDNVTITVEDTTPPVITLLGDAEITLECGIDEYEEFGATVEDICDPSPTLEIDASEVDTHTPGTYTVTYTATDASGNENVAERTVHVVDTTPPTIMVHMEEPIVLWPPNHEYHSIQLSELDIEVNDECDDTLTPEDVRITEVWSDEEENAIGNGDGNTVDDIIIGETCDFVQLRAERMGRGNGRVYTVMLEVADASGNIGSTTFDVHVPHNIASSPLAVKDEPPLYIVTAEHCALVATAVEEELIETTSDIESIVTVSVPESYSLGRNYPNPFNPSTNITYDLPEATHVVIAVYDVMGREVARLIDGYMDAGYHTVTWNAANVSSGVFIYRMTTPEYAAVRTMLLLK